MVSPYWIWVNEEVGYIITDEERSAFKSLLTDDEREQFIEQFWERRNPNPGSIGNEFKKEYYRRIVHANRRFSCHIPGWKTDRGKAYIKYGPPDEIESYEASRNPDGRSNGYDAVLSSRTEEWRYRYIDGLGPGIVIQFEEVPETGEYRRVLAPNAKDPLQPDPHESGVSCCPVYDLGARSAKGESVPGLEDKSLVKLKENLEVYRKSCQPPQAQVSDLRAAIKANLRQQTLPFEVGFFSFRATGETNYNLVSIQIPYQRLQFDRRGDLMHASIQIYGQFSTFTGRIIPAFEKALEIDIPEVDFPEKIDQSLIYSDAEPLRPGPYKLSVGVKDTQSGYMGSMEQTIRVPRFNAEILGASSVILSNKIGLQEVGDEVSHTFEIGGNTVLASPRQVFDRKRELGAYFEIYGLGIEPQTRKTSCAIEYRLMQEGKSILVETEEIRGLSNVHVVLKKFHLNSLIPGSYILELRITDRVRNQTVSPSTSFDLL